MGKRYKENVSKVEPEKRYSLDEAIGFIKDSVATKFDETIDLAVRLGVDPKQADQMVRASVQLPHGTGKVTRVVVVAKGDKAKEAQDAGADEVGDTELVDKISKGWFDFDKLVVTPDMMGVVGRLGAILGPRGLMPNPKTGTVTMDVAKSVKAIKAGKVDFRVDKTGIVHTVAGKKSFDSKQINENVKAIVDTIIKAKPASAKGVYLKSVTLSSTMGPGIGLDTGSFL